MIFSRLTSKFRRKMSSEEEKMRNFLAEIQLDQFYYLFVKNLHLTRIAHFDHVEEIDLTGIGMSKPEQRRLFEHLKKYKKPSLKKIFKKSFKRDSEKKTTNPPPHESQLRSSIDDESSSQTMVIARNNIRQGLKCLISEKDIELGEFLGKGAFGYVRKGVWKTDKGSEINVAVKCLKPSHDEASVLLQNEFINEANAMSNLDHPNLIRLYGIVLTNPMMLVTELAKLGSLLVRLRQEPEKFLISILCSFVVQIVSGMKYLESNRFIHRDLAARNILLVSYEKIKIGDFGLMRALPSDADYYVMQPTGLVPFAWCATECLKYRRFSHASDVWAFGVTVLELFSYGREPWPGLNGAEILERIDAPNFQRPERPDHCPIEIYKIIRNCCWCDDPEERKSFEVLEKLILEALPKEQNASCTYTAEKKSEISFEVGDPLTIIEASSDAECVKAQNRKTGKVGYIPLRLVSKLPPPGGKTDSSSVSASKPEALSFRKRSQLLETDAMSLASRGSASSSGSDSSSGSAKYLSTRNTLHSNPRDIPSRRQSSLSSGYGSAGPSYSSSMKEELFIRGSSEQECFSEDGASRKTSTAYETIEEDTGLAYGSSIASASISSYENVNIEEIKQIEQESPVTYENTEILSLPPCQIDIRHSSPISIRKPSVERHFSTASGSIPPQDETGSPTSLNIVNVQYIVSLPTNASENEAAAQLNSSVESELEAQLSNSAPTTKTEIKAIRKASRQKRNSAQISAVTTHRPSFGSYKEKWLPSVLPQVHQMIDNSVYECMNIDKDQPEIYEFMTENNPSDKQDIRAAVLDDDDSALYENTTLTDESTDTKPPLPPRTHRNSTQEQSNIMVPARTYRKSEKDSVEKTTLDSVDAYENIRPSQLPTSPMIPPKSSSVRPRTYNKIGEKFSPPPRKISGERDKGSDDLVREKFLLPPRTYRRSELSYENIEIQHIGSSRPVNTCYENYSLEPKSDSPPPLPRKNSQKTKHKLSLETTHSTVNEAAVGLSHFDVTSLSADDIRILEERNSNDFDLSLSISPQNRNLIDDSPIQESLPVKYGTVWDGKELLSTEASSIDSAELHKDAEAEANTENSEKKVADCQVSEKEVTDQLISEKEVSEELLFQKEVSVESIQENTLSLRQSSESIIQQNISEKEVPISHAEVKDGQILEKEVTSEKQEQVQSEIPVADQKSEHFKPRSVSLLRALLSPSEHLNRKLERSSSEDSHVPRRSSSGDTPIPPPRRHRQKKKDGRRHTLAGSSMNTKRDIDTSGEDSSAVKLPYDCAVGKEHETADAPLEVDANAPPLLPRDPCSDEQKGGKSEQSSSDVEPRKIKIKSLLSEEVANFEEKDIAAAETTSKVKEDDKPDRNEEDDDKDDYRYVVHFVTPV